MAPQSVEAADSPRASNDYLPALDQEDRSMRVVELLVAGVALLASFFLALPR